MLALGFGYFCGMEYDSFIASLQAEGPPLMISTYLQALWYDARGNWDKAHDIIQQIDNVKAAHIHAYLHRKEGDSTNAAYWYRLAGVPYPVQTLQEEWATLVTAAL